MQLSILLVLFSALAAHSSPTPEQPFESPLPLPGDAPSPYPGIPPTLALDLSNALAPLNLTEEELNAIPLIESVLSELDVPNPGEPNPELDSPGGAPNREGTVCDTTYASPTLSEIQGLLDVLYNKGIGLYCLQGSRSGSKCTTLYSYKGASASLCGVVFRVLCRQVWLDVIKIRDECKWKDGRHGWKAGGRYQYPWQGMAVLH
ncbi:hypothetical protein EDC01DRAFT_780083 [Geopyxis carbonaria]|nr:hypothetical protein EDC01DRAFT_780083 [Geopyxis carbonaria]